MSEKSELKLCTVKESAWLAWELRRIGMTSVDERTFFGIKHENYYILVAPKDDPRSKYMIGEPTPLTDMLLQQHGFDNTTHNTWSIGLGRITEYAFEEAGVSENSEHERDIKLIGEVLLREAETREWCEEYDEIIERLNERLTIKLPERLQEYTVNFAIETVVRARTESEASEIVEDRVIGAGFDIRY